MKTEVRKEHGEWILFVDDNPQFSFVYREEAEKVRNLIDALFLARQDFVDVHKYTSDDIEASINDIDKILKEVGVDL